MKSFVLLLFLGFLLLHNDCAQILNQARQGITGFRNNLGQPTSFIFEALIPTTITNPTNLIIQYPPSYQQIALTSDQYGIISCPISLTSTSASLCPTFVVNSTTSTLTIDLPTGILAGEYNIIITNNINPLTVTTNDNIFALSTVSQGTVIDENGYFGEFGLATAYTYVPLSTILTESSSVGQTSNLTFQFSLSNDQTTWIRLRVPDQFQSFPSALIISTLNVLGNATGVNLTYSVDPDQNFRWMIFGLMEFTSNTMYQLNLTIQLPSFKITTNAFLMEFLINNTNTVTTAYQFTGVTTNPGTIQNLQFNSNTWDAYSLANITINFLLQHQIINGQIIITLSNGYTLSKNCTTNYNNSIWLCYSVSNTMIIPQLTLFSGQNFTVQFMTLNPSDPTIQYNLRIQTFTTFNNSLLLVDQATVNITLSNIQTPIFQAFEMYRPVVNTSLGLVTAVDFRLLPNPGNQLPLTAVGVPGVSTILFQIPLWWRASSQLWSDLNNWFYYYYANCTFGVEGANSCSYTRQLFTITTPIQQIDQKYPSNQGLGQCDKPISIKNIMMPPIPGRFDFRVLTFKNKSVTSTPTEQDMFTMEIAVGVFPQLTVNSSSLQASDQRNLLKVSFQTGLQVPYQGVINLNFSVTDTSTASAWENQLGYSSWFNPTKNYTQIPCGLYIRGSWVSSPQCHIYDMSSNGFNVLQVSNFGVLNPNDMVILYVNNIKFCVTLGKQCQLDISTAYTVNLTYPYYLNKQTYILAYNVSSASTYTTLTNSQDATMTFGMTASATLCTSSTWWLSLTPLSQPKINDYIVVALSSQYIYLSVTSIWSDNGQVGIIVDNLNQQLIVVIQVSTVAASGGILNITLHGMRHPFEEGTIISPQANFWSNQLKSPFYQMPSQTYSGNGILSTWLNILPSVSNNLAKTFSDTDLGSQVIINFGFVLCKPVAAGGAVVIDVKDGINYNSTCIVYYGLTGTPQGLGDTVQCNLANGVYTITGFQTTSPMTSVSTMIGIQINTSFTLDSIQLYSYNISQPLSVPVGSNLQSIGNSYPFGQTGYTYPSVLNFDPFVQTSAQAVAYQRGEFYFTLVPMFDHSFPELINFNFTTIIRTFNNNSETTTDGRLHCRINGTLADSCVLNDYMVQFGLPIGYTMTANIPYLVSISTRGRDDSLTGLEGLTLQNPGIYTMFVEASIVSASNYQYTYIAVEVLPGPFWNFNVYSISKNVNTRQHAESGQTIYTISFGCTIPNNSKLIVYMYRQYVQTDGFQSDLATGIENGGAFPCYLNFGSSSTVCTLYYGLYPNPTQIEISNFGALNGQYEIRLPKVFNPNVSLSVVQVGLIATLTSATGLTTKLYSSTYNLINVTFGLPSPLINDVVYENLTLTPTFSCNNVSTYCILTMPIKTGPFANTYLDNIVFEFPSDYPLGDGYVYSQWPFCLNCSLCYSRAKIVSMNTQWGLSANTITSGWLNISTPLYRSLSGNSPVTIKTLLYKDFKLMKITWMNMTQTFNEALLTPNITADNTNINQYTAYRLQINMSVAATSGSVFLVQVPTQLDSSSGICQIQSSTGTIIANADFQCSLWNNNNSQLLIEGFGSLTKYQIIVIVVQVLNPAVISAVGNWTVQLFYEQEQPLDKLVAQGTAISPLLTNTVVSKLYWDDQFRTPVNILSGQRGTLILKINEPVGSGIQSITFPAGSITLMTGRQLLCIITTNIFQEEVYETSLLNRTVPLQCTLNNNVITIPQLSPYLATTNAQTRLIVTTLNDNNGITFPISGPFDISVQTYNGQTNTHIINIPQSNFASFSSSSLVTNPMSKTLLTVNFIPTTSASSVALMFPLVHAHNKSRPIYSGDLGTGLANGSLAGCFGRVGFPNDTLSCQIIIGQINSPGYTAILINQPVSAGTLYTFEVDSIVTPYIQNNDYTQVAHTLQSYDSSGNVLDRSTYIDYTVRNIAYSNEAINYIPIRSTDNINDVGVSFNFQLRNYVASLTGDYIIIEFPQQFYQPIPQVINYRNATNSWVSSGNNWVIYSLAAGLSANSTIPVILFDCWNSYIVSSNIVFRAYYVSNRVIVRSYTFNPMLPLIVPSDTIYVPPTTSDVTTDCNITAVTTSGINTGVGIQLLESIVTLTSGINNSYTLTVLTSAVQFTLVSVYTSPNSSQVITGSTITFSFNSALTTNCIIVYLFGTQLAATVSNTFTLTNEQSIDMSTFDDSYVSDGSQTLDIGVDVLARRYKAMTGQNAMLRLTVILQTPMLRGEYMYINVGTWSYFTPSGSVWLSYFNDMAAEKTTYSGGIIQIYSPILGIGNGTKVTIIIRNISMAMGTSSSTSNVSLIHKLATGSAKYTYTKYLVHLNPNFVTGTPYLSFISSTQNQYSIFKATLQLNNTLTPLNTLKIIFNTYSNYLGNSQFEPTLGGYTNLQQTDCIAEVLATCVMQLGGDYQQAPTMISLTPLSNTNTLTLSIPKIMLPMNGNTTFLTVSMLLTTNGVNTSELSPEYVLYPVDNPIQIALPTDPVSTITPMPNLVGSPSSYTITLNNLLQGFYYDRLVIEYSGEFIMQQPFNFNNPSLITSLTNGNVIMYPITKWLELSVNYDVNPGQSVTISNLKNAGWPQGLAVRIIEMTSVQYMTYYAISVTPSPNIPLSTYSASPSPVLISQSETLTIIVEPMNRIYQGGEIWIGLPCMGMTGGEYCSVVAGLTSAKCEVDWTACQLRVYGFSQYQPIIVNAFDYSLNTPNPIKIQLQAGMPANPYNNIPFSITIYNDSSLAWVDEQQTNINSFISIQSANILLVTLNSLNVAPQLIRGNSYGTVSLNFQLANTLSYLTSDYLSIDFGDSIVSRYYNSTDNTYYPQYNYLMCHFAIQGTLIQEVKTHRCEFTSWTVLNIYVPEEFDIQPIYQYKLTIESVLLNSSDIYWMKFMYYENGVVGNERGWMQWTINPAAFQTRTVTLLTDEASTNTTITDDIMNMTLQTPLSLPASTGTSPSRIVLSFPTYNEQNLSFPMTPIDGQINNTQQIGCNGPYSGATRPMPSVTSAGLTCYAIAATNNVWNDTPSYVTIMGYSTISASTVFNLNVGRFVNPLVSGTFADFTLTIQKKTLIGEWVTLNENTVFNIIPTVLTSPTPSTANPSFSQTRDTSINDNFGWYGVNLQPNFNLYPQDVVVLRFSYPYQVPRNTNCTQTDPITGNHYFEGCATIPYDNVFLLPNNYNLPLGSSWNSLDWYSFTNPYFSYNESGAASTLHVSIYSQQRLLTNYSINMTSYKKYSFVVLQPTTKDNQENMPQLYHLGVSLESVNSYVTYIEINTTTPFTSITSCTINRGLRRTSPDNPVVCNYTYTGSRWFIKLYNFATYSGDGLIILDLTVGNPPAGWTATWTAASFLQQGNYQNQMTQSPSGSAGGSIWVGKAPACPLHFYVYRNVESFEDRKATLNQYAQLWARVIPRSQHSNQSTYLLSMPTSYDLPNSQQTDCNVSYTTNSIIPSSNCTINSNRSVTVSAGPSGIPQYCQIISATSVNALNSNNGFLLPPNITGTEQFSVAIFDQNSTQQTMEVVSPRPYPLLPISVDATIRQANSNSIIRIKFQTNTPVVAGYYPAIPIGFQGRIEVLFQTQWSNVLGSYNSSSYTVAGFTTNLGYTQSNQTVPCEVISGLSGSVVCQVLLALRVSTYDYSKVIISNFSAIANNTPIQIHLLNIEYAQNFQYGRANVGVDLYQIDEMANRVDLSQPTFFANSLTATYNTNITSIYYMPFYIQTVTASLTPHFVGTLTTISINYILSVSLTAGCMFQLDFPAEFDLSQSGSITAESGGSQLTVMLYQSTNTLLLTVQDYADNTLTMSMVVDASFVFNYTVTISMKVISGNSVVHYVNVTVPPPQPAPFSVCVMKLSDYTASKVAVNYTFTLMPSYKVPINSTLYIDFPNLASGLNYSNLSTSNPKEVCTTVIGSCIITYNLIKIPSTISILTPGNQYSIVLSGVKNPPFSGVTPNNSFRVSITSPANSLRYLQLRSYVQPFRMYPASPANNLYLLISSSSYYKQVTSDYQIAIQTSTYTPKEASLVLDLPIDWTTTPQIQQIIGNWNLNALFYTLNQSSNATYNTLTLQLHFDIPGKAIITIKFNPLVNPNIATSSVFRARTIYDSTIIDQTIDSISMTYQDIPPALQIDSFDYQPSNEFATSLYNISLTIGLNDLPENSNIILYFPDGYIDGLLTDVPLTAYINSEQVQTSIDIKKLTLTTLRLLTSGSSVNISLYGIVNPQSNSYYIDIAIISAINGTVLEYANQQIQLTTTSRPPNLFLSYMDLSNYGCASVSQMSLCFDVVPYQISGLFEGQIWIQLPEEFEQASATNCSFSISGATQVALPCFVEQQRRLIVLISPSISITSATMPVCYVIQGIKNTGQPGETHAFSIFVFDPTNNVFTYKNYPNLNSYNTMFFNKTNLAITVGSVTDFSAQTCSLPITITLQRSTASTITLQANIDKFTIVPNPIVFNPAQTTTTFVILPQSDSPYGVNSISWNKTESGDIRYSELIPINFKLIQSPQSQYQIMLSTILSQTPILQQSSNITLILPISPSQPLTITLAYGKSPNCITFSQSSITFIPAQSTSLSFSYNSSQCAVSDFIYLSIAANYQAIYTLYSDTITVQLTQPDTTPPTVINHYIFDLDRNYFIYRIMTSQPATIYSMLTLRGTSSPTVNQLLNNSLRTANLRKTAVVETYVSNNSVSTLHANYVSYDTYLNLQNLLPSTYYVLYFSAIDLSGNPSDVIAASATTSEEYFSAIITLCLQSPSTSDNVINTIVESASWSGDYINIQSLSPSNTSFFVQLVPFANSPRPILSVQNMDSDVLFIQQHLLLCDGFTFTTNSYENMSFVNQWINYGISWLNDAQIQVWAIVQQDGYVYASTGGSYPEQIRNGLTSDNFILYETWFQKVYAFAGDNVTLMVSQLYDQTQYQIYLVAENNALPTLLMDDDNVATVVATTQVTVYSLPIDYVSGVISQFCLVLFTLTAIIMI